MAAAAPVSTAIHGIDFTSAPRPAKAITVATGHWEADGLALDSMAALATFADFEAWLTRPGPWVGGFDFPFGLPREAAVDLRWPLQWVALTRYCEGLGRERFRSTLNVYRESRPVGAKYPHRRGDPLAGAHSPIKLVNPPVALMFLEGATRLRAAGVRVPGLSAGDPLRVALEAYPGYAVRRLLDTRARVSYKNDAKVKQTESQRGVRAEIVHRITRDNALFGFRLRASAGLLDSLVADGSGDRLDATVCAMQAAWGWLRRRRGYGLPRGIDPIEGWIVTVPGVA